MSTVTYNRRRARNTGRPLGMVDVLAKVVETAIERITAHRAARKSGNLAAPTEEAATLRRMADTRQRQTPGLAADLHAAADRHELGCLR